MKHILLGALAIVIITSGFHTETMPVRLALLVIGGGIIGYIAAVADRIT